MTTLNDETSSAMRHSDPCVFCRIIRKDEPSEVIYEDEHTIAFLDITQATRGHTLVVPRTHSTALPDIDSFDASAVMSTAVRVSRLLTRALHASGINLWHASGETAWQSVFHFHLHVVPRYTSTDLIAPWTTTELPLESLRPLADLIRTTPPAEKR